MPLLVTVLAKSLVDPGLVDVSSTTTKSRPSATTTTTLIAWAPITIAYIELE